MPTEFDDFIIGTEFDDTLNGFGGDDTIEGLGGFDLISGGEGNDTLNGGEGDDTFFADPGDDMIDGGPGFDQVQFTAGLTALNIDFTGFAGDGSVFSDQTGLDQLTSIEQLIIIGSTSSDSITGSELDDIILGFGGGDLIDGGAGIDTAEYVNVSAFDASGVVSGAGVVTYDGQTDSVSSIEQFFVFGTISADTFTGSPESDFFSGAQGDDVIQASAGDDTIEAGEGSDTVRYVGENSADYTISDDLGFVTVSGPLGKDILFNVELLEFSDGVFAPSDLVGGPVDDFPDNVTTTGEVFPGGPLQVGVLETSGDRDWFGVVLEAGISYSLTIDGHGSDPLIDPVISIEDPIGLGFATSGPETSEIEFSVDTAGIYFINAGSRSGLQTGEYVITASQFSDDDFGSTFETAGALGQGETRSGRIEIAGDADWFVVDAPAGADFRFEVTPAGLSPLLAPQLKALDASGNVLGSAADGDIDFSTTGATQLVFEVTSFDPLATGAYEVTFVNLALADDFAGDISTLGVVDVDGEPKEGSLEEAGDTDWFAVTLDAGARYRFVVNADDSLGVPLDDPTLTLRNALGEPLLFSDDAGGSLFPAIEFEAQSSGLFYLDVAGFGGSFVGDYLVTAEQLEGPPEDDDFGETLLTAGLLDVGESALGRIESAGDRDWFSVDLTAGTTYRLSVSRGEDGPLDDPTLTLRDSAGVRLKFNDDADGSLFPSITFTPRESGTFVLDVAGFGDVFTGAYEVAVDEVTIVDDFGASAATSGALALDTPIFGSIESFGDQDWFALDVTQGETVLLALTGVGSDPLDDPAIEVRTADGMVLARDDNGGAGLDAFLRFEPTITGAVFAVARASGDAYLGDYQLTAALSPPDAVGSTPDTDAVLTISGGVGTFASRIDYSGDEDWIVLPTLRAGSVYDISVEGTGGDPLAIPSLVIIGGDGVTRLDAGDPGETLRLLPDQDDVGYFAVRAADDASIGDYEVRVLEVVDDVRGDLATGAAIDVDGSVEGTIEFPGDQDWYTVNLTAGATYQIDLAGAGASPLADPFVAVRAGEGDPLAVDGGVLLANDDDGPGLAASAVFTPDRSGAFLIAASSGLADDEGTYALSVTEIAGSVPDDFSADADTGNAVSASIGGVNFAGGSIDYGGDDDFFRLSVVAGETYTITLAGDLTSGAPLGDPLLRIFASDGVTLLAVNDDGVAGSNDARVTFTASEDGEVLISAESARTEDSGAYTLSLAAADAPSSGVASQDHQDAIELDLLRADPRFADLDGEGYAIVIVDTGIDLDNPAFGPDANGDGVADRIVAFDNLFEDGASVDDVRGHGTGVAGAAASSDPNAPGVAPGADIIALDIYPDTKGGSTLSLVGEALQWVVKNADTYNIAAVNLSLSEGNAATVTQNFDDELELLADLGVVVIASAGNAYEQPDVTGAIGVGTPATEPLIIGVGATFDSDAAAIAPSDKDAVIEPGVDRIVYFSQRHPDLAETFAPGFGIEVPNTGLGIVQQNGTSFSAPIVTGVVVLMQELAEQTIGRRLTTTEIQSLIAESNDVINDGDDEQDNVVNTNLDYGRLNAFKLAEAVVGLTDGNTDPFAGEDAAFTFGGAAVRIDALSNDGDFDGDAVFIAAVDDPTSGSVIIDEDTGQLIFAPDAGFTGTDTFTYSVADGRGGLATGAVTVRVDAEAPTPGSGFAGRTVRIEGRAPDVQSGTGFVDVLSLDGFTEAPDAITLPDSSEGARPFVGVDVDDTTVTLTFSRSDGGGLFEATDFNGLVITDLSGEAPDILSATVDAANTTLNLSGAVVTTSRDQILINLAGRSVLDTSVLTLDVTFAESASDPIGADQLSPLAPSDGPNAFDVGLFDASFYLGRGENADLADLGVATNLAGFEHWFFSGFEDGRLFSPLITIESLFDDDAYLTANPGVADLIADGTVSSALEHYIRIGSSLDTINGSGGPQFNPNAFFDPAAYRFANPDIVAARDFNGNPIDPFVHYLQFGEVEAIGGADTRLVGLVGFDPRFYSANNGDVADFIDAGPSGNEGLVTFFQHFVDNGLEEGRPGVDPALALTLSAEPDGLF